MRHKYNKFILSTLLALTALPGCGKDDSENTTVTAAAASTSCTSGYVYSGTYGCIPQSNCPSGYGLYSNQCVLLSATTTTASTTTSGTCQASCGSGYVRTSYGCLPQGDCASCYGYANGWCFQGY